MTPEQVTKVIDQRMSKLRQGLRKDVPRIIGKHATDFYKGNFTRQGFLDESVEPWKPAKRTLGGNTTNSRYPTLLSRRKELYNSIHFVPGDGKVNIRSDKAYSGIHNYGGTVNPTVTPKMRKFAWAMHYREAEKKADYTPWKGLALTRKKRLSITMPKRPFIGRSGTLNRLLADKTNQYVRRVLFNQ